MRRIVHCVLQKPFRDKTLQRDSHKCDARRAFFACAINKAKTAKRPEIKAIIVVSDAKMRMCVACVRRPFFCAMWVGKGYSSALSGSFL